MLILCNTQNKLFAKSGLLKKKQKKNMAELKKGLVIAERVTHSSVLHATAFFNKLISKINNRHIYIN